jgi:hypothetical protein
MVKKSKGKKIQASTTGLKPVHGKKIAFCEIMHSLNATFWRNFRISNYA